MSENCVEANLFDIHCQLDQDIIRKRAEAPTLEKAIVVAGAMAIRNPGEWSIVYRKNGKVYLKLRGVHSV